MSLNGKLETGSITTDIPLPISYLETKQPYLGGFGVWNKVI